MSAAAETGGPAGTRPVGERHRIDTARLMAWLSDRLRGVDDRHYEVRQFAGGQSNPTYLLRTAGGDLVLRKQPSGKLLAAAHAVDREWRILQALADAAVPVPRLRLYCDDPEVIGTPFYVMDYVPARVMQDPALPGLEPPVRSRIYADMARILAALHTLDWRALGLADFGRGEGFLARQLKRWGEPFRIAAGATGDAGGEDEAGSAEPGVAAMRRLLEWLDDGPLPAETVSLIHGDYRIGNLMLAESDGRIAAVLDWELATLGHPLSDLAYNCAAYYLPAGHPVSIGLRGLDAAALGIPDEAQFVSWYTEHAGTELDPAEWHFFKVFSLFRIAAIQHGVYQRARRGNAASDNARLFGDSYRLVAETALELIGRS